MNCITKFFLLSNLFCCGGVYSIPHSPEIGRAHKESNLDEKRQKLDYDNNYISNSSPCGSSSSATYLQLALVFKEERQTKADKNSGAMYFSYPGGPPESSQ